MAMTGRHAFQANENRSNNISAKTERSCGGHRTSAGREGEGHTEVTRSVGRGEAHAGCRQPVTSGGSSAHLRSCTVPFFSGTTIVGLPSPSSLQTCSVTVQCELTTSFSLGDTLPIVEVGDVDIFIRSSLPLTPKQQSLLRRQLCYMRQSHIEHSHRTHQYRCSGRALVSWTVQMLLIETRSLVLILQMVDHFLVMFHSLSVQGLTLGGDTIVILSLGGDTIVILSLGGDTIVMLSLGGDTSHAVTLRPPVVQRFAESD